MPVRLAPMATESLKAMVETAGRCFFQGVENNVFHLAAVLSATISRRDVD